MKEIHVQVQKRKNKKNDDFYILLDEYNRVITFDLQTILRYYSVEDLSKLEYYKKEVN